MSHTEQPCPGRGIVYHNLAFLRYGNGLALQSLRIWKNVARNWIVKPKQSCDDDDHRRSAKCYHHVAFHDREQTAAINIKTPNRVKIPPMIVPNHALPMPCLSGCALRSRMANMPTINDTGASTNVSENNPRYPAIIDKGVRPTGNAIRTKPDSEKSASCTIILFLQPQLEQIAFSFGNCAPQC